MSNKLWYKWDEMRRDVNTLCRNITLDKFDPQVIVGLSRGGLTAGVMMSHWFQKPFKPIRTSLRDFPDWEDYLPRKTDERVLIVDDICDSGETLKNAPGVYTATLHYKKSAIVKPTLYAELIEIEDNWVVYPWERYDSAPVRDNT